MNLQATEGLMQVAESPPSLWMPLGRGSDGRFGLRRFRAKLNPTAFGTRRAFNQRWALHNVLDRFHTKSVQFYD
jgi:hypothetical protein